MISVALSPYHQKRKEIKVFQLQLLGRLTIYFLDRVIVLTLFSTFLHKFSMENFYQIKIIQHYQVLHTVNTQQNILLTKQEIFFFLIEIV